MNFELGIHNLYSTPQRKNTPRIGIRAQIMLSIYVFVYNCVSENNIFLKRTSIRRLDKITF